MDKYLIDTSSLLSLVRYFHPFDKDEKLYAIIKKMFDEKQCLILESVFTESGHVAGGIILKKYSFLKKIKREKNIDIISPKLHKKIDDNWVIQKQKNKLNSDIEYETQKNDELGKADFQLIFMALNKREELAKLEPNLIPNDKQDFTIVSEESRSSNNNKLFKKIPIICKEEKIPCITLPKMLEKIGLRIEYH